MKKLVPVILCLAFVFTACSKQAEENTTSRVQTTQTSVSSSSNMFSDRDYDDSYDENNCVLIKLNGDTVQCSDAFVTIDGSSVTVTQEKDDLVFTGGDGIDSNGSLKITGDSITVCGPNQSDTSILDYDTEGIITGGTFIGTGGKSMAVSFSDSEQGVVFVSLSGKSGDSVIIKDSKGNVIAQTKPALNYDAVIISAPELEKGKSYSLTAGGSTVEVKAS